MRDAPDSEEDELDDLPYTLPPGPYLKEKPDFSYAALIGQAILSSPEHRLTLQDIYEWITTVYPFYTRGEQTWMNSIRHSLSTMAVFRKITRGRNEGKSLWAIWDCDIPCFANGGFRKSLCADMVKSKPPPAKSGPKRKTTMDDAVARDVVKKPRRSVTKEESSSQSIIFPSTSYTAPVLPPFYAPMYSNPQQQPYYQPYVPPPVPADSLFPPLPTTSAYHRALSMSRPSSASISRAGSVETGPPDTSSSVARTASPDPSRPASTKPALSSSGSVPELTSSSSTVSSPPLSSLGSSSSLGKQVSLNTPSPGVADSEENEMDKLTAQWLASPGTIDALERGYPFKNPRPNRSAQKSVGKEVARLPQVCIQVQSTSAGLICLQRRSPLPFLLPLIHQRLRAGLWPRERNG